MKRIVVALSLLLCSAAFVFAGGQAQKSSSSSSSSSTSSSSNTTMQATANGNIGGSVSVLGVWGGNELKIFNDMIKPFEQKTGVKVQYEGTRDLAAILTTRVQAGNPPQIAAMPSLGQVDQFANQGKLVDLSTVLNMNTFKQQYAKGWINLGTVNGKLVTIFTGVALKGLVWYDPKTFEAAGLTIPKTWDQMMKESKQLAAKGITPWTIGLESGSASGWPGADWIQEIFLKKWGPELYTQWWKGKLKWTSPQVKYAFKTFGEIATNSKLTYGGNQYELSTNFGSAFDPVFQSPPKAYFHEQATFIQSFIQKDFPNLKAGTDFSFFPFPSINPKYANAVQMSGNLLSEFAKSPQSDAFVRYFASPEAQAYWVKAADSLTPNRAVPLSDYPGKLFKQAGETLRSANIAEFSADDLMPNQMETAFWSAVMSYVSNPGNLDSILKHLDQVQQSAYSKG